MTLQEALKHAFDSGFDAGRNSLCEEEGAYEAFMEEFEAKFHVDFLETARAML